MMDVRNRVGIGRTVATARTPQRASRAWQVEAYGAIGLGSRTVFEVDAGDGGIEDLIRYLQRHSGREVGVIDDFDQFVGAAVRSWSLDPLAVLADRATGEAIKSGILIRLTTAVIGPGELSRERRRVAELLAASILIAERRLGRSWDAIAVMVDQITRSPNAVDPRFGGEKRLVELLNGIASTWSPSERERTRGLVRGLLAPLLSGGSLADLGQHGQPVVPRMLPATCALVCIRPTVVAVRPLYRRLLRQTLTVGAAANGVHIAFPFEVEP